MALFLTTPPFDSPNPDEPSIVVFSNDMEDARFHKRLQTFVDASFSVRWLAYDRGRNRGAASPLLQALPGLVLGKTCDRQYLQRIYSMVLSVAKLLTSGFLSGGEQLLYCINLDNLLVAIMAKIIGRHQCRVAYEVADIQPVLLRLDRIGQVLRALERWCLKRTDLVVYTSEHYMSEFLRKKQDYRGASLLLENKIYPAPASPQRSERHARTEGDPVIVGFFGQLKCRKSLDLIQRLAADCPRKVRFVLRGYPNDVLRPAFERLVRAMPNVSYGGPFKYPSDLPEIYGAVDLCWGFDFCSPGANSKWTLANRLYEAGYFGVPILVEADTAGGDYVRRLGSGWVFPSPLEESLKTFFSRINATELLAKKDHVARLDKSLFVLDSDLVLIRERFRELFLRVSGESK